MNAAISTHILGGQVVVRVDGDLDSHSAAAFQTRLRLIVTGGHTQQIVVNLAGVPVVDYAGLMALLECHLHGQRRGGDLRLAAPPHSVHKTLTDARFDEVLEVYPALDEALFPFVDHDMGL